MNKDKILKLAKGFRGRAKNCNTIARERVDKALEHAYVGRKEKKRFARALWVTQINNGVRQYNLPYSSFISGLALSHIKLDRKSISNLAVNEPYSFRALVLKVKDTLLQATGYENGKKPKNAIGPYNQAVGETRHLVDKI